MPNEIESLEFRNGQLGATSEYLLQIVLSPPGTGSSNQHGCQIDDRSISVANTLGSLWMWVYVEGSLSPIAHAVFAATPESTQCDSVWVDENHRRKHIATALYKHAESIFGVNAHPSDNLADDAVKFWSNRKGTNS